MNPVINGLFKTLFPSLDSEVITSIAHKWKEKDNYLDALGDIEKIEKELRPIGIWNVKYNDGLFSYRYPQKFDNIYREFKYVYMRFYTSSPLRLATTRDIVHSSAAHVENSLKLFCQMKGIKNYEKKPLVQLVKACKPLLKHELADAIIKLGIEVDNFAKHYYDIGTNEPLFSIEEVIATYLCCRKLGYQILVDAGILPEIQEACQKGPLLNQQNYI